MIKASDACECAGFGSDAEWRMVEAAIDREIRAMDGPHVYVDFYGEKVSMKSLERAKAEYGANGWTVAIERTDRPDLGPTVRLTPSG